ncbi:hypothetical protein QTJ16_000341 [Diplocarpon rosae]|uniref:Uncharacterized protein n=1 Tax=Diplocarpon rosae TaxID=946125 RepID=A0AAD9WHB9_9HELO|nr:hypothetical protein QTJ16_000341 [Diplocarpon rosae]
MFQRDQILPSSSCIHAYATADQILPVEETYANDDFDDVFGSCSSPSLGPSGNLEPSDIPRLKEKHETEGYRDGVTKGKGRVCRRGLTRVGGLKGEGLEGEKRRVQALLEQAKRDLGTRSVFERKFWGEDGIWRFEVPGEKEADGDVVFSDVAAAHPLVKKWEGVLEEEVRSWGLDLGIWDGQNGELEEESGGLVGTPAKEAKGELESENVAESLTKIMGIEKKDLCW